MAVAKKCLPGHASAMSPDCGAVFFHKSPGLVHFLRGFNVSSDKRYRAISDGCTEAAQLPNLAADKTFLLIWRLEAFKLFLWVETHFLRGMCKCRRHAPKETASRWSQLRVNAAMDQVGPAALPREKSIFDDTSFWVGRPTLNSAHCSWLNSHADKITAEKFHRNFSCLEQT